jgi:DNA topoisomerase-1
VFAGCSNYPECKNTYPLPRGLLILATEDKCEVCGAPKIKTVGKGQAPTIVCIDPKCEGAQKERYVGRCPSCGGDILMIQSRKGKRFAGCANYPNCKVMYPLPQMGKIIPTRTSCEACGAPIVNVLTQRKGKWTLCVNMKCPKRTEKKTKEQNSEKATP